MAKFQTIDFIGIGAQKCATSWLLEKLVAHPAIYSPEQLSLKEIAFFSANYYRGITWYNKHFDFSKRKLFGEFSVTYLSCSDAPSRIAHYNSNIKLLVALRNPIERAYSQHLHQFRRGRLPVELHQFTNALQYNPAYLEYGLYAKQLQTYLRFFSKEQIHVVFFDDIVADPGRVVKDVYSFLGVDSAFKPPLLTRKTNDAHVEKSVLISKAVKNISRMLKQSVGLRAVNAIKKTGLTTGIRSLNKTHIGENVPPLTSEERDGLYEYFSEDLHALEQLLHVDLSHWKPAPENEKKCAG